MAHHVATDINRPGKTFSIRPTVTFYHDAVEAKKDTAIGSARIHFLIQRAKSATREQIAELSHQRAFELAPEHRAELPCGAFCGLERYVPRKALGYNHIYGA